MQLIASLILLCVLLIAPPAQAGEIVQHVTVSSDQAFVDVDPAPANTLAVEVRRLVQVQTFDFAYTNQSDVELVELEGCFYTVNRLRHLPGSDAFQIAPMQVTGGDHVLPGFPVAPWGTIEATSICRDFDETYAIPEYVAIWKRARLVDGAPKHRLYFEPLQVGYPTTPGLPGHPYFECDAETEVEFDLVYVVPDPIPDPV